MSNQPTVSVIGLGKLGACIAACFAHKGYSVIGADVSAKTVELVNERKAPVFEPGLAEMMASPAGSASARCRTSGSSTSGVAVSSGAVQRSASTEPAIPRSVMPAMKYSVV